jgi:hypothetical protein
MFSKLAIEYVHPSPTQMCECIVFWKKISLKKNKTNVSKIHMPTWVGHFVKYGKRHNITQPYVNYPQVQNY